MSEDEAADTNLLSAIDRVDKLPWPKIRHRALSEAIHKIAYLLHFDIVRIEPPVASAGSDSSSTSAPEKPHGKQ